jgi:deoxyribose-phosphate aldolase
MNSWDAQLAAMIDHTLLKPEAAETDIVRLCQEAIAHRFAAVVVQPFYVPVAAGRLSGSGIPVCSVVAFPFGAHPPEQKALESRILLEAGAGEIDMVMNIGAFLSGNYDVIRAELDQVVSVCRGTAVSKLIIETACLDREGIVRAAGMGCEAGFDFIKTSTGYASRGASLNDIELIRSAVGTRSGIKASGGIKTREGALELIKAGATRIGCSASLNIIAL